MMILGYCQTFATPCKCLRQGKPAKYWLAKQLQFLPKNLQHFCEINIEKCSVSLILLYTYMKSEKHFQINAFRVAVIV